MYKINDFSKKSNTSVSTLRYYDEINLLKPAYTNIFTNYRYYTDEQLKLINIISDLKDINLPLEDIKKYIETNDVNVILKQKEKYTKIINKNNEFFDDFVIYKENNWITFDQRYLNDDILLKEIIKYFKNLNFDYITYCIPDSYIDLIN